MRHISSAIILLCGSLAGPVHGQGVPFPVEEFDENLATARWLVAYDRCAWRSTDELLKQPRESLQGLSPVWLCLEQGGAWDAVYGQWDEAADQYRVAFHYRVARDTVVLTRTPLDTARLNSAARAISTTLRSLPAAFAQSGARFNTYVQPRGDSALSVWVLPAWQTNGVALFGAEARHDYRSDGRVRVGEQVIEGPLRGTRPDTTVAFRIDSNGAGVPTVGDLVFFFLMRPYFASIRIQTERFSSTIVRTNQDEAWVHVVRSNRE